MADNLKHFGIPGMKWGIRRRGPAHADSTTAHTLKKKHVTELSNDDIKKVVTRLNLEKQLSTLNPKTVSVGQKIFGTLISKFGGQILASFLKRYTKVDINDPFNTGDAEEGRVNVINLLEDKNN